MKIELREIVEWSLRDFLEKAAENRLRLVLDRRIFLQHRGLRRRENAIEPPQDRKRQNDLPIFVPLVRSAKQIADTPDEIRELGMSLRRHRDRGYQNFPFEKGF